MAMVAGPKAATDVVAGSKYDFVACSRVEEEEHCLRRRGRHGRPSCRDLVVWWRAFGPRVGEAVWHIVFHVVCACMRRL